MLDFNKWMTINDVSMTSRGNYNGITQQLKMSCFDMSCTIYTTSCKCAMQFNN